jgi:hypothetical protein
MARKVFFSFHFERDSWRVGNVRSSHAITGLEKTPFLDAAAWERSNGRATKRSRIGLSSS